MQAQQTNAYSEPMELINELPPEVLTRIFGHTINTTYDPWNIRSAVSLTLTLCSVCSYWRRITTANSLFWSCIPMGNDTQAGKLTKLFLARSQESPLIDVVAFARYASSHGGTWQATEELKPHIHRLHSLSIVVTSFPQVYTLLGLVLTEQVPASLVHLSLMAKPDNTYPPKLILDKVLYKQHFMQLCNQLQTLEMNNIWTDFDSYSFGRLERLTLDVNFGFLNTVSCLLPAAYGLRFLEVRDIATWRVRERTDPELAHDAKILRLRHPHPFCRWELQGGLGPNYWDIIDFHLPHNLTAGPKAEVRRNLESLVPYMHVNSSKITLLTLRNERPEVLERISTMLQVLPNLHTLTFDGLKLTESILSLFVPPPQSLSTFPKIRTLRLLLSDVLHPNTLRTLILSHPIQHLYLWRSTLHWGDGTSRGTFRPTGHSAFYEWLCKQVPELYISNP